MLSHHPFALHDCVWPCSPARLPSACLHRLGPNPVVALRPGSRRRSVRKPTSLLWSCHVALCGLVAFWPGVCMCVGECALEEHACVNSTPCVHVVVAPPPPSLPFLSHRRSERPPWVDHAIRLPWLRVWFYAPPGSPALGGCPSLVCTVGDLGHCVWLCVCVCVCLHGLLCVLGADGSCLHRILRCRPSNSLGPWLAQVSKACVALFAACLPLRCSAVCGMLARKLVVPPPLPMSCALPRLICAHTGPH